MRIRLFLTVSFVLLSLFLCVSCGSGGSSCDEGYTWNSSTGECEKDTEPLPDKDNYVPPTDNEVDDDATSDDSDVEDTDEVSDADEPYTGECVHADGSGVIAIDITQRTMTFGTITSDITLGSSSIGEIWGEHTYTRSTFKIADVDDALSGKSVEMPMDSYRLYYHHILADGKVSDTGVQIGDTVKIDTDKTVALTLPLAQVTGAVTKNGAAFSALTGTNADDTEIVLSNATLSFTISYADFGSYALEIPHGKYALYFKGYFSDASPFFEGQVLPQESGVEVTASGEIAINIPTITTSGSASFPGEAVATGTLVLINNPPFGAIAGTLIADFTSANYAIEMLGGAHTDYTVVYLPTADSYPTNWVKIENWTGFDATGTHNVVLDFGRLYGTISLKGGNFPALTECEATEAICTRGKLKLLSFDGSSSILLKNLGATGDDYAYEALVVRRIASDDPVNPGTTIYTPRKYTLAFESFYNDINGIYEKISFFSEAKYLNNDSVLTAKIDFQKPDETYYTQREIDINITPRTVSGTISFNGAKISCDKDEYIYARNDVTKDEVPIINLRTLTDTTFSVQMPEGSFDFVYDGECLLGNRQKAPVLRDVTVGSDSVTGLDVAIQTSRFFLQYTINGTPYKEWLTAHPEVKKVSFTVGTEGSALRWELTENTEGDTPTLAVLNGEDWDLSMTVITGATGEESESIFPLYSVTNMKADVTVESDVAAVPFETQLTVDGKAMTDASEWRGRLEFGSESFYSITYPKKGATNATGFVLPGVYKVPSPDVLLNGGFDAGVKLRLECLYISD